MSDADSKSHGDSMSGEVPRIDAAPLYFPSRNATLFGWLHRPAGGRQADIGLVICKPFGYDAICAHRSLRAFADAGAAMGIPSLRFDYAGTGDSADIDPDTDQIAQWTADILAAAEMLRSHCRVERVCLLGLRMGALLAALAAARSERVSALIAIAPVVNGRRYLRELRTFQAAAVKVPAMSQQRGRLEVTGFSLSAASVESLQRTDLMDLPAASTQEVLLILDRSDLPAQNPGQTCFWPSGREVRYESLPGFAEMMSTPHAAAVPQRMIDSASAWLNRLQAAGAREPLRKDAASQNHAAAPATRRRRTASPAVRPASTPASMNLAGTGGSLSERAIYVDESRTLFGILTAAGSTGSAGSAGGGGAGARGAASFSSTPERPITSARTGCMFPLPGAGRNAATSCCVWIWPDWETAPPVRRAGQSGVSARGPR